MFFSSDKWMMAGHLSQSVKLVIILLLYGCVSSENRACKDPGSSVDGERVGNCCLSGDTLRFYCKDGYELVGEAEIRCLSNGLWSSRRPLCRPLFSDYCEFPDPIPHGLLEGRKDGDYFVPGEQAEVLCQPGYRCEENDVVACKEGGIWEKEFGVCKEVFCDPPPHVAHGKILELQTTNLTKFPYNFESTYSCDEGYRIVQGDISRVCTNARVWSGNNVTCEVIRCPDPGVPENGIKSSSNYSVGSRIRFKCNSGCELLGEPEIFCQANGQWSGEPARCNLPSNYCPDPGTPIRGSRSKSRFQLGARVRFGCDPSTFMVGSAIRECLPDRTWSGNPTKCVASYDFDNPRQVRDLLITRLAEIKEQQRKELNKFEEAMKWPFARTIDFEFPGRTILYFAFDVSGSIPLTNFHISLDLAKAIVREVGVSEDGIRVTAITFAYRANIIFLPLEHRTVEDVFSALDEIEYTGGSTSISSALRQIRREVIPLVQETMGPVTMKSVLFIFTDGKYNMGGNPKMEANILKSQGVEIYSVGITGNSIKRTLYEIASQTTYAEDTRPNAFMLQDYTTLTWLVQEIAYGAANYSQCGLGKENVGSRRRRIVGGFKAVEPWPWMAALYMSRSNEDYVKELMCGGSIIHQHFILTSAICMYNNRMMREEKEIIVKLGLTDLDNRTYLQEFDVRKIYVHDKFSLQTYDYDVALLELMEPIEFNAFVRPICLPPKEIPEDSPFYKPESIVWIAGWGHVRMRRIHDVSPATTVKHLKEIALPIQTRETCEASLLDYNGSPRFTDRMFCTGTGGARNDTCTGDIGGPVMQMHLNEAGYISWTQVGLVSWGTGCGLPDTYGMNVHLQNVMPWVDETIEKAE